MLKVKALNLVLVFVSCRYSKKLYKYWPSTTQGSSECCNATRTEPVTVVCTIKAETSRMWFISCWNETGLAFGSTLKATDVKNLERNRATHLQISQNAPLTLYTHKNGTWVYGKSRRLLLRPQRPHGSCCLKITKECIANSEWPSQKQAKTNWGTECGLNQDWTMSKLRNKTLSR